MTRGKSNKSNKVTKQNRHVIEKNIFCVRFYTHFSSRVGKTACYFVTLLPSASNPIKYDILE